jgi:hypothetical protein
MQDVCASFVRYLWRFGSEAQRVKAEGYVTQLVQVLAASADDRSLQPTPSFTAATLVHHLKRSGEGTDSSILPDPTLAAYESALRCLQSGRGWQTKDLAVGVWPVNLLGSLSRTRQQKHVQGLNVAKLRKLISTASGDHVLAGCTDSERKIACGGKTPMHYWVHSAELCPKPIGPAAEECLQKLTHLARS